MWHVELTPVLLQPACCGLSLVAAEPITLDVRTMQVSGE